jgi:hypothetical protein
MYTDVVSQDKGAQMREVIALHESEGMSHDELKSQEAMYQSQGWTDVQVRNLLKGSAPKWTTYEWSGIRPEPSEPVHFVNVTSREPSKTELLELLADEGITGVKIDYWSEPYPFEDGFQIDTVWYKK